MGCKSSGVSTPKLSSEHLLNLNEVFMPWVKRIASTSSQILPSTPRPMMQQAADLPCIALDFDHTLTSRHIYKALGPGYYDGRRDAHPDAEEFAAWCEARQLPTTLPE